VDKNGEVKGLRAELLACFPEEHRNRCDAFRLQGQHVAYALHTFYEYGDLRNGPCIITVDWTFCNSGSLAYPRKVIWRIIAEVRYLPLSIMMLILKVFLVVGAVARK
jgi:hypothetical protein